MDKKAKVKSKRKYTLQGGKCPRTKFYVIISKALIRGEWPMANVYREEALANVKGYSRKGRI